MTLALALKLLGYAIAGTAVGLVFFLSLLRSTEVLAAGGSAGAVIGLYAFRIVLVVAASWFAVQQGALALLVGLAGFLAARLLIKRRMEGKA